MWESKETCISDGMEIVNYEMEKGKGKGSFGHKDDKNLIANNTDEVQKER